MIVVAIVGNAAEHYSRDRRRAARRDDPGGRDRGRQQRADRAAGRAGLVLYSFAIGRPMSLLFNAFEITAIALSVMATAMVVNDGESNWVEGLQLMSVYLILALAFYFVP